MAVTPPAISLIICTRNRAASLKRCIDSLPENDILEASGELIVVNNSSTDDSEAVLSSFAQDCPFPVAIVNEPKLGLSNARNAGLRAARGEIIAFTDDDCYLAPDYMKTAVELFQARRFDYCGGRILLHDETDAMYTVNYREAGRIFPPDSFLPAGTIQGCNMVFRRKVVETIGFFDPMLGPGTPFRGDDIDYCATASLAGFVGAHVPELVVYHHHGRKPGKDIEALKKANDYARGAYYVKFVLMGTRQYLTGWLREMRKHLRRKRPGIVLRELRGAAAYTLARAKARRESLQENPVPDHNSVRGK